MFNVCTCALLYNDDNKRKYKNKVQFLWRLFVSVDSEHLGGGNRSALAQIRVKVGLNNAVGSVFLYVCLLFVCLFKRCIQFSFIVQLSTEGALTK